MQLPIWITNTFNGVTNAKQDSIFGALAMPVPPYFHQYFNDFDVFTAGDWVITETDSGATEALTAGDGGLLLITNTAADDDLVSLQKTPAAWTTSGSKRVFFEARLKVSDATQSDILVGLEAVTTTPFTVVNGLVFQKLDGSTSLSFQVTGSSTSSTASAIATVADDTYLTVSFYYDGVESVVYAVNGTVLGSLPLTNLPSANLTVTVALRNGEAAAKTMTVDYLFAAKERQSWPMQ